MAKAPEDWAHSKTLARRSAILINVKRFGTVRRPSTALIWNEIVLSEDLELVYGNLKSMDQSPPNIRDTE